MFAPYYFQMPSIKMSKAISKLYLFSSLISLNNVKIINFKYFPQFHYPYVFQNSNINTSNKFWNRDFCSPIVKNKTEKLKGKENEAESCLKREGSKLIIENVSKSRIKKLPFQNVQKVFEICSQYKISNRAVTENKWMFKTDIGKLREKLKLLSEMSLRTLDHGIPFLQVSVKRLQNVIHHIKQDEAIVPEKNRLYYLSRQLKVEPVELSKYIAKRLFVYSVPFDRLQNSLAVLLEKELSPQSIMNDIWVLKYHTSRIISRLKLFEDIGRKPLMPWMVKCTAETMKKSINLTSTTNKLLGKNDSVLNYLAEKLNCSLDVVEEMAARIPAIHTVRASKIQDVLDYLFSKGYTSEDIILVPRVLAHSLKTLQTRLEALHSLNEHPKNLNTLCKTKKDFQRYLEYRKKYGDG